MSDRFSIMVEDANKARIAEIREVFKLKAENDVITLLIGILDHHGQVPVDVIAKVARRGSGRGKRD